MAGERVTVLERLSGAMVSDDLSVRDSIGDADYLAALGMAMTGRPAVVSSMLRLSLVGDKASLSDLLRHVMGVTRRLAMRRRWKLSLTEIERVSRKAIEHIYAPTCPTCNGRKFKGISGSPGLSTRPCDACHGTGLRRLPIRYGREIAEVMSTLTAQLDGVEFRVKRRLY